MEVRIRLAVQLRREGLQPRDDELLPLLHGSAARAGRGAEGRDHERPP
jgi:hypothetical protein